MKWFPIDCDWREFRKKSDRDTAEVPGHSDGKMNGANIAIVSREESDVWKKMGKLHEVSATCNRSEMDDLLSATDGGKHDYDWLLSPPGSSSVSTPSPIKIQPFTKQKANQSLRSVHLSMSSKTSMTKPQKNEPSRSYSLPNTFSSSGKLSMLTTSPSSIISSSSSTSTSRSSTTPRPSISTPRATTPVKPRPVATAYSSDKPRTSVQSTRSATPTQKPPSPLLRSNSRSSTPSPRVLSQNPRTPTPVQGGAVVTQRRPASPIATRGRISTDGFGSMKSRTSTVTNSSGKRVSVVPESTGFGRSFSNKSLDMAIRHMDIRKGSKGVGMQPGMTRYPQSVRSSVSERETTSGFDLNQAATPTLRPIKVTNERLLKNDNNNIMMEIKNVLVSDHGNGRTMDCHSNSDSLKIREDNCESRSACSSKISKFAIYESCRYDMILLKEESNTNWLQSMDEDHRLESLPEPFGFY